MFPKALVCTPTTNCIPIVAVDENPMNEVPKGAVVTALPQIPYVSCEYHETKDREGCDPPHKGPTVLLDIIQ
jgi:hypothetical protein